MQLDIPRSPSTTTQEDQPTHFGKVPKIEANQYVAGSARARARSPPASQEPTGSSVGTAAEELGRKNSSAAKDQNGLGKGNEESSQAAMAEIKLLQQSDDHYRDECRHNGESAHQHFLQNEMCASEVVDAAERNLNLLRAHEKLTHDTSTLREEGREQVRRCSEWVHNE